MEKLKMKIKMPSIGEKTTFQFINWGEVFADSNGKDLFMKIPGVTLDNNEYMNCVNLQTGILRMIEDTNVCFKLNATLNIENVSN